MNSIETTPSKKPVPSSPSILRLFSSPGMSPINRRKNWILPQDTNQFINELSFKNQIIDIDAEDPKRDF
jgi:hypothetical protein